MNRRIPIFLFAFFAATRLPLAAAAPLSEDVPVPPAVAALAGTLGLPPETYRATFAADLVRVAYSRAELKDGQIAAELRAHARDEDSGERVLVPVPLGADVWSRVIFKRTVASQDLLTRIISDRRAALLCHGLAGVDDETLAYFADHPASLVDVYEHASPAFGVFASSLHVRSGRIAVPGGASAAPMWEAAVGAPVDRPDRFIRALYGDNEGRLAYLYDTISELDAPHAAFALGTWIADDATRRDRFQALALSVVRSYREWTTLERPFVRPVNDFAIIATRLRLEPSGAPRPPASRAFWNGVFDITDSAAAGDRDHERGLVDAAYLAEATNVNDMYVRADRVDQFAFAQRVFTSSEPGNDAVTALKGMPHERMLLLALERMGVTRPAVYVTAEKRAREATTGDANRVFWTLAQLQGSLAVIAHLRQAGTLDEPQAERLVLSLSAVPLVDGRYDGGVARWIDHDLVPLLPAGDSVEARLVLGLSGLPRLASNPRIEWEGQQYRLDFGSANARRLRAVREKQGGNSVDDALDLARLSGNTPMAAGAADGHARERSLQALASRFERRSKNALVDLMAPGVAAPPPTRDRIDRVVGDLDHVDERSEPERALRAVQPLVEAADTVLSEALLSLVYAVDLGDPDGTALLASNVALRHDFGFTLQEGELRARRPWDVPRQDFLPDVPWHVTGSLLSLDVALAPLALKHIDLDRPAAAPRLRSTEREAFAVDAALLDHTKLRDDDRGAVVAAIARGRGRVEMLAQDRTGLAAVASGVRMDGWRERSLVWTIDHDNASVPAQFSLVELYALGGGAPGVDLDAWGMSAYASLGCVCTHMPEPGGWRLFEGRPQLAFMSFVVSDLNLRVAALLDDLHLPAALETPVLAAAVQDLIDEASPSDASDWLAIAQTAQALTRQRVEDYVAAAAAVNGPLVPMDEDTTVRRP
ncbi:MAG TPA: hypothetical protein VHZ73_09010 [Vicinamibacterales bacterium]|nr:hypothetical protein [Vicinamibacterales bacterium]